MIICIAGVSSTGKTTLLNKLKNNIDLIESLGIKVEFKQECIRDYVKEKYDKSFTELIQTPGMAVAIQFELADFIYDTYLKMIANPQILYICDRSPLDALVYTTLNYACAPEDLMVQYAEKYNECCHKLRLLNNYVDRIYLTLPDMSTMIAQNDGFRPTQYNCRRYLEIELFNSLFEFNPKVVKLPSLTELRVATIMTDLIDKFYDSNRL